MSHINAGDWKAAYAGDHYALTYIFGELLREGRQLFGFSATVHVVATWAKRQSGDDSKSLVIVNRGTLGMVLRNTADRGCTNLTFWAQLPDDDTPKPGQVTLENLFG